MTHRLNKRYARSLLRMLPKDSDHLTFLADNKIESALIEGEGWIDIDAYSHLFMSIVHSLQPALHGDKAEGISQWSNYRLILNAMVQSKTLAEAISACNAFLQRLLPDSEPCKLSTDGQIARWQFDLPQAGTAAQWSSKTFSMKTFNWGPGLIGHATTLWLWHRIICWLIGSFIDLQRVEVTDDKPQQSHKYQALFNTALIYNANHCQISFASRYLDFPISQNTEQVAIMMARFPADLFHIDSVNKSHSARIRQMIGDDFSRPTPSVDDIAARLCISVPTLHRHLQKEHTSFQRIKNEQRHQAALSLLSRPDLSIAEAGSLLGYSDTSTFYRAFKKWTGQTPLAFRNSQ